MFMNVAATTMATAFIWNTFVCWKVCGTLINLNKLKLDDKVLVHHHSVRHTTAAKKKTENMKKKLCFEVFLQHISGMT